MDLQMQGKSDYKLVTVADYEPLIGAETVERIGRKAERLADLHVVNVNSTYYGGGVAEILSSLTLLMNESGIKTGWRVIQGRPEFFSITKKMHNALQGSDINLSDSKKNTYEEVVFENAARMHLDHDLVIVHDPQPLPLIQFLRKRSPWVWRCHVDLSAPNPDLWAYLAPFIERYDAVVLSLPEYAQKMTTPQRFIMPAINPFSTTNRGLTEADIADRLDHYGIPTDLPLVVQVSRFDKWKDPQGVIQAFNIARKQVKATLVLVGNVATDDPEGQEVFASLCGCSEERIRILSVQDFGTGQCAAKTGCGRTAKIDPRRVWINRDRGDVEGGRGDWWPCGRHPSPDRGWGKRLPSRHRGASGRADCAVD